MSWLLWLVGFAAVICLVAWWLSARSVATKKSWAAWARLAREATTRLQQNGPPVTRPPGEPSEPPHSRSSAAKPFDTKEVGSQQGSRRTRFF
jgi:hypothetical protein